MNFIKKLFGFSKKTPDELAAIKKAYQDEKRLLGEKVNGFREPAVRLARTETKTNSKFGGQPVVEIENFTWPLSSEKPMAFLAQIDLSEIAVAHQYDWLPAKGTLLFFYDVIEMPWGFDPKDRGKWKVIFVESPNQTASFPASLTSDCKFPEIFLISRRVELLPECFHPSVEALNLTDDEVDMYIEFDEIDDDEPLHQVGGFATSIQNSRMDLESQLASNGLYLGNGDAYQSEKAKELESGAKDWKLLLEIDSDEEFMWGDVGMLYFWVEKDKARNKNFNNVWLILQCH